jgi:hypothetical protein
MDFEKRSGGCPSLEEYAAGYVGLVITKSFSDSHLALFDASFFLALSPAFAIPASSGRGFPCFLRNTGFVD